MKSLLVADLSQLDSPQTTREAQLGKAEANEQTWQSSEEARASKKPSKASFASQGQASWQASQQVVLPRAPPQSTPYDDVGMREWGEIKGEILFY